MIKPGAEVSLDHSVSFGPAEMPSVSLHIISQDNLIFPITENSWTAYEWVYVGAMSVKLTGSNTEFSA